MYNNDSKFYSNNKPLKVFIGDMVQIVDQRSSLYKKYGLVENISFYNKNKQITVKIGPRSYLLQPQQLRFCTRINHKKIKNEIKYKSYQNTTNHINNSRPQITFEEEDNIGNR